jgi:cysteine-rich repeat protein
MSKGPGLVARGWKLGEAMTVLVVIALASGAAHSKTITQIIDSSGDGKGKILDRPSSIAVDGSGNVYVAGSFSDNAFKITPGGVITEIIDSTGDGMGNLFLPFIDQPGTIAVDGPGNVYVVGGLSDNAFKITPGGAITEIIDSTGDGIGNPLQFPQSIAVDDSGNVYVPGIESDNAFKITPGGVITEIIDSTGDGLGNTLNSPRGIAVDGSRNVFVTGVYSINAFKITPGGVITEIIDSRGDGIGNPLEYPESIAVDGSGSVYVAGLFSRNIFKITPEGAITEIIDRKGDGLGNPLKSPRDVATDSSGNVYVAAAVSNNAFKITFCGDGILDPGEECDDGNNETGDGCSPSCFLEGFCGDGTVQVGQGEECDDGNILDGDGCSAFCLVEPSESVEESIGPGGIVTTDPESDGATASDVLETTVTTPNGGTITIFERPITSTPPDGFELIGEEVSITAPDATASVPLVLVLRLDATIVPAGEDENSIAVFKDGIFVPACTGVPGTADPDPCVLARGVRVLQGDEDAELTILMSTPGDVSAGISACPAEPDPTCNEDAVNIILISDKKNKPKLNFKWLKGSGLGESVLDFGDPEDQQMSLCLYKDGTLSGDLTVPVGDERSGNWRSIPDGFKYTCKANCNDGIEKLLLMSGAPGSVKVMLAAKGSNLRLPRLPLGAGRGATIAVQLHYKNDPSCWGMHHSEALKRSGDVMKEKSGLLKLKRTGP